MGIHRCARCRRRWVVTYLLRTQRGTWICPNCEVAEYRALTARGGSRLPEDGPVTP